MNFTLFFRRQFHIISKLKRKILLIIPYSPQLHPLKQVICRMQIPFRLISISSIWCWKRKYPHPSGLFPATDKDKPVKTFFQLLFRHPGHPMVYQTHHQTLVSFPARFCPKELTVNKTGQMMHTTQSIIFWHIIQRKDIYKYPLSIGHMLLIFS